MQTSSIAIVALLATSLAALAPSGDANGPTCPDFYVDVGGHAYVVTGELASEKYPLIFWLYVESKGRPDLQRGGETLLGDLDVCEPGHVVPDEIIL